MYGSVVWYIPNPSLLLYQIDYFLSSYVYSFIFFIVLNPVSTVGITIFAPGIRVNIKVQPVAW